MLADRLFSFRRACVTTTSFAVLLAAQAAHAQTALLQGATDVVPTETAATQSPGALGAGLPSLGPAFQFGASTSFSESYITNATGLPGSNRSDYLSTPGFNLDLHEHSRRVSLDANYGFSSDFYANGTLPTQINNNLQAVGNAEIFPDYLNLGVRAFAAPVVVSNLGIVTADDRVVPNGFRNSYGYYVDPDLKFAIGEDFATSETTPSYGQAFFTTPPGSSGNAIIPGLAGPQNTTSRSLSEKVSSGTYFSQLDWTAVGLFSETARQQGLLSEKSGIANLRYALDRTFSLLTTVGYDAITNSTPLNRNMSGIVALAGFGVTSGQDFQLQIEAGEKYDSLSFSGDLHYNVSPTILITASANDYVQTPEGQLLNNLTSLTALPNGTITSGEGTPAATDSLATQTSSNIQSPGNPSLDQNISRYQTVNITLGEDFERNHANVMLFGTRRTILSGAFIGPATTNSWGIQGQFSRDLSPLLVATIDGAYTVNQELGGNAQTFTTQGQLSYSLSRETKIFVRSEYLDRISSSTLQALSPFTGSISDIRATLGITHAF